MLKRITNIGDKFNNLTIVSFDNCNDWEIANCICDCGNTINVKKKSLLYDKVKSCGCTKKRTPQYHLIGEKFGSLTINNIYFMKQKNRSRSFCDCTCDCGVKVGVWFYLLKIGHTRSCGCYKKNNPSNFKHGLSKKGQWVDGYAIYNNMIQRCYNKNCKRYKDYGGRGISVCDSWREGFINFYNDMGKRPSSNYSLDRIDVDGNYEPSNCRWATNAEQASNTRKNVWIEYNGERKILSQWCKILNVNVSYLSRWIKKGKSFENFLIKNKKQLC